MTYDLLAALNDILETEDEFRKAMPDDWEGDPLTDACSLARAIIATNAAKKFPDADVPVTLTGSEWTAVLGRITRPNALSPLGRKTYNEAAHKLKKQLLAASDRHPSEEKAS